jgi:tetratricopeptide (TPR) repeat protein
MKEKQDTIKITSGLHKEISSTVVINGKKHLILTEDIDPKEQCVVTKVYLGGKLILTRSVDCKRILKSPHAEQKIKELINRQHKTIAEMLKKEHEIKIKTPSDYLNEIKNLLQKKDHRAALELLSIALEQYPEDPFLMSYYGCLQAIINRDYAHGIEICKEAIRIYDERASIGKDIFYPTFYLNLGRAYLAARRRKEAVQSLQKGLAYDRENKDVLWEMKKLGVRRAPAVPYLERSNPVNKYIGMLLHAFRKDSK